MELEIFDRAEELDGLALGGGAGNVLVFWVLERWERGGRACSRFGGLVHLGKGVCISRSREGRDEKQRM